MGSSISMRSLLMEKRTIITRISRGGQVTVPAPVRRRWETERVALEDHGDYLLVRPVADPIDGFIGFAARSGGTTSSTTDSR